MYSSRHGHRLIKCLIGNTNYCTTPHHMRKMQTVKYKVHSRVYTRYHKLTKYGESEGSYDFAILYLESCSGNCWSTNPLSDVKFKRLAALQMKCSPLFSNNSTFDEARRTLLTVHIYNHEDNWYSRNSIPDPS